MVAAGAGDSRRNHQSKSLLFLFTKPLIEATTELDGQNTFPFEFQFPREVLHVEGQSFFEPNSSFAHLPGHPLPPSYLFNSAGPLKARTTQSVEYYVEAVVEKEQMFGSTVKVRKDFLFSPSRDTFHPDSELVTRSSLHERASRKLDPALKNERVSFKEKTKRLLTNGGPEPTAAFTVSSTSPSVAYVTGPVPISLSVTHDEERSTAPTKPEIILKSAYARLLCMTSYRVPQQGISYPVSGDYMRSSSEKTDLFRRQYLNIPTTTLMDLGELFEGLYIPAHLPPTFKTYTLSVHYVLRLSVSLVCVGKEYVVDFDKGPLFVHPGVYRAPPDDIDWLYARAEDALRDIRAPRLWDAPPEEELPPPTYYDADSREWGAMITTAGRPNVGFVTQ